MTLQEFSKVALTITSIWGTLFDDLKTEIWYGILKDLDYKTVNYAIGELAQNFTGYLTPAHIRQAYINISSPQISIIDAIEIVNKAIRDYGLTREKYDAAMGWIKSQDEIVYQIVKVVGWRDICMADPNFWRPELERLHREVANNAKSNAMLSDEIKLSISKLRDGVKASSLTMLNGEL